MQRFLQVDDDLAAVGKADADHAARALAVQVGIGGVVDAVAACSTANRSCSGTIQGIQVGHYNLRMLRARQILSQDDCPCAWRGGPGLRPARPLYLADRTGGSRACHPHRHSTRRPRRSRHRPHPHQPPNHDPQPPARPAPAALPRRIPGGPKTGACRIWRASMARRCTSIRRPPCCRPGRLPALALPGARCRSATP